MEYYHRDGLEVSLKADSSPVTSADMASHELIVSRLRSISPYPVLSEEDPAPYEERQKWKSFWLVDPLDGTKDFIARTDDFTINVALVDEAQPICGVVAVPARSLTYYGVKGEGAFRIEAGKTQAIRARSCTKADSCVVSRFHLDERTKDFCGKNGISELKAFGSALKLCKIAEGEADIYPRFGPTKEWDTAAGHCVVNEAGGKVVSIEDGRALRYNKENLVNPGFIAAPLELKYKL